MKHRNNFGYSFSVSQAGIVLSLEAETQLLENGVLSFIRYDDGLYCYKLVSGPVTLLRNFPNALHYLDRFWLLLPENLNKQRLLWERFYRFYSPNYEELIDCSNNMHCLHFFRRIIESQINISAECKLLDFGCGPGLSAGIFPVQRLIGYDSNEDMLSKARNRGMSVIDQETFRSMPSNSFDGCIACYVFHMAIADEDIFRLADLLGKNGFVVANYYKNLGEDRMTHCFQSLGFDTRLITNSEGRFGSVFIYRK